MTDPSSKRAFFGENPFAQHQDALHADTPTVARPPGVPDSAEVTRLCRLERAQPDLLRKAFG